MDVATIFYTYIAACIAANLSYMINDNNNKGKHHKDINQFQVQSPIEVTHIYIYTLPHRRVSSLHQIKIKRIMHSIEHMIELHSHIITSASFPSFWNVFRRKMEKNIIIITSKHVEEFLFFTPRNHFLSIFPWDMYSTLLFFRGTRVGRTTTSTLQICFGVRFPCRK